MWASGVGDLGLTESQFWNYTPAHIYALSERRQAQERRMDERFAVLYCMYANAHRDSKQRAEPFDIEDFIGPRRGQKYKHEMTTEEYLLSEARKHASPEQQAALFKGYADTVKQACK